MIQLGPEGTHMDDARLLMLWECGLGRAGWSRADALLEAASGARVTARTPGELNAALVALHARMFGRSMDLLSHCPSCGVVAQFSCDGDTLVQAESDGPATPVFIVEEDNHRVEFRLPEPADLESSGPDESPEAFADRVIARCVLASTRDHVSVPTSELPISVLDAVSQRMEALDPDASLSFALACPECAARWSAPLDLGELVWQKVQAAAEHLLLDIDALARAYGWTEADVLRLSPERRAAYVQMVTA